MNRRLLLFLSIQLFLWGAAHPQLLIRHIDRSVSDQGQQTPMSSARTTSDPLQLPFWDDFSTSTDVPDSSLWEYGEHVFINNTIGENPPTFNVATFDGAQRNGTPYQLSEEKPGPTDSLISRVIDLSDIPSSDRADIFLSFFWQLRGLGEIPESVDSIRLQLLAADSVWYTIWSQEGGANNLDTTFKRFNYEEINLQRQEGPDRVYFHDNFRMKFQAFSTFRGIFDTWSIDYVYMNRFRRPWEFGNVQNLRLLDGAVSRIDRPLFGPFYELPLDHFNLDRAIDQQQGYLSNLDDGDVDGVRYSHIITNTNTGTIEAARILEGDEGILGRQEIRPFPGVEPTILDFLAGDSIVLESEFYFSTDDQEGVVEFLPDSVPIIHTQFDIRSNDTLRHQYLLQDHYAYDDGTAEFSAGINLDQGQLAVQFVSRQLDTLTHVDIHFPALPTTDGRPMDVVIWKNLSEDEEITRASHIVQGSSQRNEFARIRLSRGQILQDTFYIGFQQFTDDYVGVGLDRSNAAATDKVFVNVSREWVQNTEIVGALMIRPVFGDADDLVLSSPVPKEASITIFPNPSNGFIRINGTYEQLEIFDLGGRSRLRSPFTKELDVSRLPRGLYIVRFHNNQTMTTSKLIIE